MTYMHGGETKTAELTLDSDADRVQLLIHPDPSSPRDDGRGSVGPTGSRSVSRQPVGPSSRRRLSGASGTRPSRATGTKPSRSLTPTMWRVDLGVVGDQLADVGALALEQPQVGDLDRQPEPVAAGVAADQRAPLVGRARLVDRGREVGVGDQRRRRRRARRCCTSCGPAAPSSASPSRTVATSADSGSTLDLAGRRLGHQVAVSRAQPSTSSSGTGPDPRAQRVALVVRRGLGGELVEERPSGPGSASRRFTSPSAERRSRAPGANSGPGCAGAGRPGGVRPGRLADQERAAALARGLASRWASIAAP